jgi:hypothetical protein
MIAIAVFDALPVFLVELLEQGRLFLAISGKVAHFLGANCARRTSDRGR